MAGAPGGRTPGHLWPPNRADLEAPSTTSWRLRFCWGRLNLDTGQTLGGQSAGQRQVAAPGRFRSVPRQTCTTELDEGLVLERVCVPLGRVGVDL